MADTAGPAAGSARNLARGHLVGARTVENQARQGGWYVRRPRGGPPSGRVPWPLVWRRRPMSTTDTRVPSGPVLTSSRPFPSARCGIAIRGGVPLASPWVAPSPHGGSPYGSQCGSALARASDLASTTRRRPRRTVVVLGLPRCLGLGYRGSRGRGHRRVGPMITSTRRSCRSIAREESARFRSRSPSSVKCHSPHGWSCRPVPGRTVGRRRTTDGHSSPTSGSLRRPGRRRRRWRNARPPGPGCWRQGSPTGRGSLGGRGSRRLPSRR